MNLLVVLLPLNCGKAVKHPVKKTFLMVCIFLKALGVPEDLEIQVTCQSVGEIFVVTKQIQLYMPLSSYIRYLHGEILFQLLSYAVIFVMFEYINFTLTRLRAERMLYEGLYYHQICWQSLQQTCFPINILSARGCKVLFWILRLLDLSIGQSPYLTDRMENLLMRQRGELDGLKR